ncbi:hypothetical protein CSUI_002339 [Cystoisospora suis]|uniref:Uncharacterized protein n=1 Tax=Cystoisospora suis TaxID=483139 RepID=A0A2C6L8G5_9APIC|nr:hypothetical protein CSUI_002339 [Cystoisospora suis]
MKSGNDAPTLSLFKLAWPSEKKRETFPLASEKHEEVRNFSDEHDMFPLFAFSASLSVHLRTTSKEQLFGSELQLFECAVAEEGGQPKASFVPRGSMMRAILRDEIYRAVEDALDSGLGKPPGSAARRRVSLQFVNEANQDQICVDIGRRVRWGPVDVHEYEVPEKIWDGKTDERVDLLKSQYKNADLEVVYRLLVDEYSRPKPVILVTPGGKKYRSSVSVTQEKLIVTKEFKGLSLVDVAVRLSDISGIYFGKRPPSSLTSPRQTAEAKSADFPDSQYLYIVFKDSSRRRSSTVSTLVSPGEISGALKDGGSATGTASTNLGNHGLERTESSTPNSGGGGTSSASPLTVSIVFPTEAERNSFVLLLRTSLRILSGASVGNWEDTIDDLENDEGGAEADKTTKNEDNGPLSSYESVEDLFKPFTYKVYDTPDAAANGSKEETAQEGVGDHARLVQCIAVFGNGVNVQKATTKGTIVTRRLALLGASLQLLSLKTRKGQIVGVFDDVIGVEPGQDDDAFREVAKKGQLPSADLCAVVKLTDHSFALVFPTKVLRDNFVFMMKHLDESDEVLKYLDDGVSGPPLGHRPNGGGDASKANADEGTDASNTATRSS